MIYKISEFANITKISPRMLRYLDREGVLKPNFIDDNGYRYYSDVELEIASRIIRLKKYHFTYPEIKDIIDKQLDSDPQLYKTKLESLKDIVNNYDILILEIEKLLKKSEMSIMNIYDIKIQVRAPHYALFKSGNFNVDSIEYFIESSIQSVKDKCNCALIDKYYISFYGEDILGESYSEESIINVGFFQPISEAVDIQTLDTIKCKETIVLSTIHYGNYDMIYNAYVSLFSYAKKEGYEITGPYSEKYFVDSYFTQNYDQYITEVFIEVSK